MKLRDYERMFDAEIVINATIKLDKDGGVENKDELQKCPHCNTTIGKIYFRATDEAGTTELRFRCSHCSKRWILRYKNPFLFIEI